MFRVSIFSILISLVVILMYYMYRLRNQSSPRQSSLVRSFSKAGAPDQMEQTEIDDFENSKMVSEGSQFGVQYFNEVMYD